MATCDCGLCRGTDCGDDYDGYDGEPGETEGEEQSGPAAPFAFDDIEL